MAPFSNPTIPHLHAMLPKLGAHRNNIVWVPYAEKGKFKMTKFYAEFKGKSWKGTHKDMKHQQTRSYLALCSSKLPHKKPKHVPEKPEPSGQKE